MPVDLDRLLTTLNQARLQTDNPPLYQVIAQLLKAVREFQNATSAAISGGATDLSVLTSRTYLTAVDETATLPNSRELLAGTDITFDDTIAGERTINSSAGSAVDHVVMSDGATPIPEPVNDGFGNFIYVMYTP